MHRIDESARVRRRLRRESASSIAHSAGLVAGAASARGDPYRQEQLLLSALDG